LYGFSRGTPMDPRHHLRTRDSVLGTGAPFSVDRTLGGLDAFFDRRILRREFQRPPVFDEGVYVFVFGHQALASGEVSVRVVFVRRGCAAAAADGPSPIDHEIVGTSYVVQKDEPVSVAVAKKTLVEAPLAASALPHQNQHSNQDSLKHEHEKQFVFHNPHQIEKDAYCQEKPNAGLKQELVHALARNLNRSNRSETCHESVLSGSQPAGWRLSSTDTRLGG
jgi:hypothetical protein